MFSKCLQSAFEIGEHVIIPETHDLVAMVDKLRGAYRVPFRFRMLTAVEFDDEVGFAAGEVGNVWPYRLLADELEAKQLPVP